MKKIALVPLLHLPCPPVLGGAVETIVDNLCDENEKYGELDFYIFSIYNKDAKRISKKYKNSHFYYISKTSPFEKCYVFFRKVIRKLFRVSFEDNVDVRHEVRFFNKLKKEYEKHNFDYVVIEGPKYYAIPISKFVPKEKIYTHIHGEAFKEKGPLTINSDKNCGKIICVSNYIKKVTMTVTEKEDKDVLVLMNCIDTSKFNKSLYQKERKELRKKFNVLDDEVVITFCGRTIPDKGVRELIKAIKLLPPETKYRLMIIGSPDFGLDVTDPYVAEIVELSKNIKDKIIFTGFIHNSKIPHYHAMSDIFTVPSIWDDPCPLTAIEGMSSGLPLVVTDSGGMMEYVTEESAFTIVRNDDLIKNMSDALLKLINDSALREKMGKAARERVKNYNLEKYYFDFVNIFKE